MLHLSLGNIMEGLCYNGRTVDATGTLHCHVFTSNLFRSSKQKVTVLEYRVTHGYWKLVGTMHATNIEASQVRHV